MDEENNSDTEDDAEVATFRTGGTQNSTTTPRNQTQCNFAINEFKLALATTLTGTESTASTAISRTTPKMNVKKAPDPQYCVSVSTVERSVLFW